MARAVAIVGPGAVGSVARGEIRGRGNRGPASGANPFRGRPTGPLRHSLRGPAGRSTRIRSGLRPAREAGPRPPPLRGFFASNPPTPPRRSPRRAPLGPRTPVVALQNGLAHAPLFRRAFGPERTVIGSCYIAADRPSRDRAAQWRAPDSPGANPETPLRPSGPGPARQGRLVGPARGRRRPDALDQIGLQRLGQSPRRRRHPSRTGSWPGTPPFGKSF